MVLDNKSIVKLIRDITVRLARLEKSVQCAPTPTGSTPPPPVTPPSSSSAEKTDYSYNFPENVDGVHVTFTLTSSYVLGTCKVYLDGQRLTPGVLYDYIEVPPNRVSFNTPPRFASNIVVDYKILT